MAGDPAIDTELQDLPQALRWRTWMQRIEAVLFASARPVPRTNLAKVVGQGASLDLLIEDLAASLEDRAFEVVETPEGWFLRTRKAFAPVIHAAADLGDQALDLNEGEVAVLAVIAYHQPVTREGLREVLGRDISRDLIGRLHAQGLIGHGPRAPRQGAPYTYVTTERFLTVFDLASLQDLPDPEQWADAGLVG